MFGRIGKVVRESGLFGASLMMIGAAVADSEATLDNIREYGHYIEGNPIIRGLMHYTEEDLAVYLPKIVASSLAIYAAKKMKEEDYKIRGEHLLYGAAIYWSAGALLNLII